MKYKTSQILALVDAAAQRHRDNANTFAHSDNPQIVECYHSALAKASAFDAVSLAMRGIAIAPLNIEAAKF